MKTVYQFALYNVSTDEFQESRRWGTREAIQAIGGRIVGIGVDVADDLVGGEIEGLTERNFDPHSAIAEGFPRQIGIGLRMDQSQLGLGMRP